MSEPARGATSVPWRLGDLLVLYATTAIGVVLVLSAWYAASDELTLADQTGWLTVGTAGVVVLGAGNLAWLLAGWRAVTLERRRVCALVPATPAAPAAPAEVVGELVAARSMTRFHRPDCALVAGKRVRHYALATHEARGRRPCDVCQPTTP